MNTFSLLIAFFAFVTIALAAAPAPPTWPLSFSSSVLRTSNQFPYPFFSRWFYDYNAKKSRIDGPAFWRNEIYFGKHVYDHANGVGYTIYYKQDEETCFQFQIPNTPYKPDFSTYTYAGVSNIDYIAVNHWIAENTTSGEYFQFFDTVSAREPFRFDVVDDDHFQEETWTFMELDASSAAQDPTLFVIPDAIKDNCNKMDPNPASSSVKFRE